MSTTRRHFLTSTTLGAGLATELMAEEPQRVSPNDRIRVALIGNGIRGFADAHASLAAGAEMAAVSDVYDGRLTRAKEDWGHSIFTSRDYREVLARPDVDAVIIATPDHWHRQIAVDAMKAGKDVYCEKPMVQLLGDGAAVIETAKKAGRILQVGSQRVSSIVYQKARELLDRGSIGELNLVEAFIDRNTAIGAGQYLIPPHRTPAHARRD